MSLRRLLFRKILFRKIFPLVYLCVIVFAVSETSLSAYYAYHPEQYKSNPFEFAHIIEEYKSPFVYIHLFRPDEIYTRNNFLMRRDSDITELPQEGMTRILSYGDSVGLGYNVSPKETYSQVLEDMLNGTGRGSFEVLNMARGNSPSLYVMHMKRDIEQFKPQRVIVEIELLNDIADEAFVEYGGVDSFNFPTAITNARYWPEWQTMPPISPHRYPWEMLALRKFLFDFNRKLLISYEKFSPNPLFASDSDTYYYSLGFDRSQFTQQKLDHSFDRMIALLKGMEEYTRAKGIDFLLVILPSHFMFYEHQYNPGAIRTYNKAIASAKQHGITHIGLFDSFTQNNGYSLFFDFVHPKALGYSIIADEIYSFYQSRTN